MGIYLFRTDHFGAYNDIYRVLVTPVVGHLYVKAGKACAVLLLCRGLRPNRTCRIGRGRPLHTP